MKAKRWTTPALAAALVINLAGFDIGPSPASAVDLSPAIKIGDFTTSRYLFDKAYNQFIASGTRRRGPNPTRDQVGHWFRLYLAQQVIKADLVEQKQLDRPEVVEITARMGRYMLTQPHGPLYRKLGGADEVAFRRERRTQILRECQFTAFPENTARLWMAISPSFGRGAMLREADVADIASSILARYIFNGASQQLSAIDFVQDFQQGIARMAPRDVKSLGEQIEDIVIAKYDLAEASRLGLDQTPQFLEDRHNFALNQALALYEKEVLSKQVAISPDALAAWYRANHQRYASPLEVTGALFVFADQESARRGMAAGLGVKDRGSVPGALEVIDPVEIRRDGPLLFPDVPYPFLASAPSGGSYGPFGYAGKYAVFLKRTTGELAPVPLERIQDQVRRDLLREKLDALELEGLSRKLDIVQVLLDLSVYNIENLLPRLRTETVPTRPLRDEKKPAQN